LICIFTLYFCTLLYKFWKLFWHNMHAYLVPKTLHWTRQIVLYLLHVQSTLYLFSCFYDGSCLIYVICVCWRIVVSNTYCVVFLFFFVLCTQCCKLLWIVHFLFCLSLFSNVYLLILYECAGLKCQNVCRRNHLQREIFLQGKVRVSSSRISWRSEINIHQWIECPYIITFNISSG